MTLCRTSGASRRTRRRRIDTIVCDFQILFSFDPSFYHQLETRHGLPAGHLGDVVQRWPTAQLATVAAISYQQWLHDLRQSLPAPVVQSWLTYHGTLNTPAVDILTRARSHRRQVYLVGNATQHLHDHLRHHRVEQLPTRVITSADLGYAKPDPAFYTNLIAATGLDPTRTLSIEPDPGWAQTARRLGIPAHPYRDPGQLLAALIHHGMLPRPDDSRTRHEASPGAGYE